MGWKRLGEPNLALKWPLLLSHSLACLSKGLGLYGSRFGFCIKLKKILIFTGLGLGQKRCPPCGNSLFSASA